MFVRLLIGRQAGSVVDMPYDAATSGIAMGTAANVTDQEIVEAGFEPVLVPVEARPEMPPPGYVIKPGELGGFDVFDPFGLPVNEMPAPNLAAARSLAYEHAAAVLATAAALIEVQPIGIPDDWRDMPWQDMRALAKNFEPAVTTKDDSITAIEAELARRAV